MVAALWSNSNWDDDKGSRKSAIEDIEKDFERVVELIHSVGKPQEPETTIDHDNPFFAAADRGIAKLENNFSKAPKREEPKYEGLDLDQIS